MTNIVPSPNQKSTIMKTRKQGFNYRTLNKTIQKGALLGALALAACWVPSLEAQLYVTSDSGGSVGSYNFDGTSINSSLVTGLAGPYGLATNGSSIFVGNISSNTVTKYSLAGVSQGVFSISGAIALAISGNTLYVANYSSNIVSTYDAITGSVINANFITGLDNPRGLALDSSGNIFVSNYNTGVIGKYNATTGAAVNASLVTGAINPFGITVDGNDLYVSNFNFTVNTIGKYSAVDGSVINSAFVTEIGNPTGLAVHNGSLYAASYSFSTIGQFSTVDGSAINRNLITGLQNPVGLLAIPEPGTYALLALGGIALLAFRKRQNA